METYIETYETRFRKTNKLFGVMDDVVQTKEEMEAKGDWYDEGFLIFVENEQQVYKVKIEKILKLKEEPESEEEEMSDECVYCGSPDITVTEESDTCNECGYVYT